jgi:putative membrane protein
VVTDRQIVWFVLSLVFLWAASDWPVGALGAGYLLSVHMLQYMLYVLAAAPLLLLATPEWMARRVLGRLHLYRTVRVVCRPVPAAVFANVVLVATHAPWTVDLLRTSQVGSFALDMVWLLSGLVLWMPVVGPLPELVVRSVPLRMVYLFIAAGAVPMVPGGFLTFAGAPLYRTYELAPRVGLEALADQQIAGVIMKVGNLPVIWLVLIVLWARWVGAQRAAEADARRAARRSTVPRPAPPTVPPAPAS